MPELSKHSESNDYNKLYSLVIIVRDIPNGNSSLFITTPVVWMYVLYELIASRK